MASSVFKQLLEESKQLVSPEDTSQLPVIDRGLDLIDIETQQLANATKADDRSNVKGEYFLAYNGIHSQKIEDALKALDATAAFEPVDVVRVGDIDKYLRQTHDKTVMDTIDQNRRHTENDFRTLVNQTMNIDWKTTQRTILEEWDQQQHNRAFGSFGTSTSNIISESSRQRIPGYAKVVTELNNNRRNDRPYLIIDALSKATTQANPSSESHRMADIYNLLKKVAGETKEGTEHHDKWKANAPYHSPEAAQFRQHLLTKTKTWLEEQYQQHIENALLKHAEKARIGGFPSVIRRIQAFVAIKFANTSGWINPNLEIQLGMPIWAFTYCLLRTGHAKEALEFARDYPAAFDSSDPMFYQYLKEYVTAPDNSLSRDSQRAIHSDYQRIVYGEIPTDPYKQAVYKIIGRCELSKKTIPQVITTTEDYIWLQLCLVRENETTSDYGNEHYNLLSLQKSIKESGVEKFDPHKSNPWLYVTVLLLTLQYERAIHYLYTHEKYRVETVHLAIACAYYQLLRIPKEPIIASVEMLIVHDDEYVGFNFARLIHQYIRAYLAENVDHSLQYLYLLSLYASDHGYNTTEMLSLCHTYICELVLKTKDWTAIVGTKSVEHGRKPGLIDPYKKLVGVHNEKEYIQNILLPAARGCTQKGRWNDAIFLYEMSKEYNRAITILMKQLGDALQQSLAPIETSQKMMTTSQNQQLITQSLNTLKHYEHEQHISSILEENKKTAIRTLIQLLRAHAAYAEDRHEIALEFICQTQIIPFQDNYGAIQKAAIHFEQLDNAVSKNIPALLVMVMEALYKIWSQCTSIQPRAAWPTQVIAGLEENMRAVLAFVGMIQYIMPADTMIRLNRMEVMIANVKKS
ncbi:Nup93/Nic96-domain-containing protein [Radiomyces spectabilis]|uniref:Nup93/Nic96-domain-containing protein n=1 Tax=Radiomyces spectabilis TaxID=64574 RepID=UPI0022206844|nr:Nup93/Nic96-domain-containing protein [Radiomyces spectabilis]KAI8371471.1 Nup93/Nic96-domain-containing protein [Radiomyces spectabilis]